MREETVTYKIYKFSELSDSAKQKALTQFYDINVDYEWWDGVYEDAKRIGLIISEFDTGRGNSIKGKFTEYPADVAKLILKEHGKTCETYLLAEIFLKQWNLLACDTEETDALEEEFERALKEEYLHILRKEYEYLTSEEAIVETILANDYDFLETGKLY